MAKSKVINLDDKDLMFGNQFKGKKKSTSKNTKKSTKKNKKK